MVWYLRTIVGQIVIILGERAIVLGETYYCWSNCRNFRREGHILGPRPLYWLGRYLYKEV